MIDRLHPDFKFKESSSSLPSVPFFAQQCIDAFYSRCLLPVFHKIVGLHILISDLCDWIAPHSREECLLETLIANLGACCLEILVSNLKNKLCCCISDIG